MALNALAALAAGFELGVPLEVAARALGAFPGIHRRFEIRGEADGRIVLDDYAHHPAEVRATLAAARAAFRRRMVVIFQPHRYTRLRDLFDDFLGSFDEADILYLLDVYPAGEEPIPGVSARRLCENLKARGHLEVRYLGDRPDAAATVAAASRSGDLIVTLGAGNVYELGDEVLRALDSEVKFHERA
jgi:UDP-N-acetylmuramate--alanine ligase